MGRTLQIRDVPDEVHSGIHARAAEAGKSVSQYLLDIATELASHPPMSEVVSRAKLASRTGGASGVDITKTMREIRE